MAWPLPCAAGAATSRPLFWKGRRSAVVAGGKPFPQKGCPQTLCGVVVGASALPAGGGGEKTKGKRPRGVGPFSLWDEKIKV